MHGFVEKPAPFAVPKHRRRDGKMPEGSRRWIAAIAKQYRDVLSEQPRRDEKHTEF